MGGVDAGRSCCVCLCVFLPRSWLSGTRVHWGLMRIDLNRALPRSSCICWSGLDGLDGLVPVAWKGGCTFVVTVHVDDT